MGLLISALPRDKVKIEFENILSWDETKHWYKWPRKRIRDEKTYSSDPVKVIDSYRYLEKYFFDNSDFNLARHFYIGQMVMTRKDGNYDWPSKILNRIYQFISNYGESIIRPLIGLVFSLVIFPILLLLSGMNVNRPYCEAPVWANYDLEQVITNRNTTYLWNDYKSVFGANLALSTFDRKHELSPPSDSFQRGLLVIETLINVIFASLIVFASRRKFTPKKPQGS